MACCTCFNWSRSSLRPGGDLRFGHARRTRPCRGGSNRRCAACRGRFPAAATSPSALAQLGGSLALGAICRSRTAFCMPCSQLLQVVGFAFLLAGKLLGLVAGHAARCRGRRRGASGLRNPAAGGPGRRPGGPGLPPGCWIAGLRMPGEHLLRLPSAVGRAAGFGFALRRAGLLGGSGVAHVLMACFRRSRVCCNCCGLAPCSAISGRSWFCCAAAGSAVASALLLAWPGCCPCWPVCPAGPVAGPLLAGLTLLARTARIALLPCCLCWPCWLCCPLRLNWLCCCICCNCCCSFSASRRSISCSQRCCGVCWPLRCCSASSCWRRASCFNFCSASSISLLLLRRPTAAGARALVLVLFGVQFEVEQALHVARGAALPPPPPPPPLLAEGHLDIAEGGFGAQQVLQRLLFRRQRILPLARPSACRRPGPWRPRPGPYRPRSS